MITADEAREIMPVGPSIRELEKIETSIKEAAQQNKDEIIWRGSNYIWARSIQQYMYRNPENERVIPRVQHVLDTLRKNGFMVEEYELNSQFTDLGFRITWS